MGLTSPPFMSQQTGWERVKFLLGAPELGWQSRLKLIPDSAVTCGAPTVCRAHSRSCCVEAPHPLGDVCSFPARLLPASLPPSAIMLLRGL